MKMKYFVCLAVSKLRRKLETKDTPQLRVFDFLFVVVDTAANPELLGVFNDLMTIRNKFLRWPLEINGKPSKVEAIYFHLFLRRYQFIDLFRCLCCFVFPAMAQLKPVGAIQSSDGNKLIKSSFIEKDIWDTAWYRCEGSIFFLD